MAHATLGFPGGPHVAFSVDPENIAWNWQVITNVVETVGGRVVQVLGAYLSDLTVTGSFGQVHAPGGESWRLADQFLKDITKIMEHQSLDSRQQDKMQRGAVFTYPPLHWRFQVYVKDLSDPDGGNSVVLRPGKFNQRYQLTLFIIRRNDSGLVKAGSSDGGAFSQRGYDAVAAFMARISDGIGWHFSQYNGPVPTTAKQRAGAPPVTPLPHHRDGL